MATYCEQADLYASFPSTKVDQYAAESGASSETIKTNIEKAIVDADAEIDLYLRTKYTLPLEYVDQIINQISIDITLYTLMKRRNLLDDKAIFRYNNALKKLERIAKGEIILDLGSEAEDTDYPCSLSLESDDLLGW